MISGLLSVLLAYGFLLLHTATACSQDTLLIEDFEDISDWQQKESRGQGKAIMKDRSVEIESHRDGTRPGAYLRVIDRSPTDHWFWIHKRREDGCWDLSQARTVTLWARCGGTRTMIRFLVADDRGNIAYYAVAPLQNTEWELKSLDLARETPFATVGTVDWCRVVLIGLRTDPGHGYTVDFDDLSVSFASDRVVSGQAADALSRPAILERQVSGFLASVSSAEISDSIVAVNLTRSEGEKELDLLAEAGIKWAKLSCFMPDQSARVDYLVDSLLARGISVVGHLPHSTGWTAELFPNIKGERGDRIPIVYSAKAMEWYKPIVRRTAEHLKGRVLVWEIGNEPDIQHFWKPEPDPSAFATFVIEISKVLKSVDPANKVINGGVCSFWKPGMTGVRDYLTAFLKANAGRHIDFLGLHAYRPHAEQGAPDITQRQAAEELRKLLGEFGLDLPFWDTEWQSTGMVDRAEVPFATDLYQAKYMLRKYLVEADAGFKHMHWQISKPGITWDHPGQIFTIDSRPTYKYVTLRHVGALFSRIGSPAKHPLRPSNTEVGLCLSLLKEGDFDAVSSLRRWHPSFAGGPDSVLIDAENAFRGRGAMRLSGTTAFQLDSVQRWKPLLGGQMLDIRGVVKGTGSEVAIYPTQRDARGQEIALPTRSKRGWPPEADYKPFCVRYRIDNTCCDFGLRIEAPKGGTFFIDSLALIYRLTPAEVISFAFDVQGSKAPALFFWMPLKPVDEPRFRAVDTAIAGLPDGSYVLLDTFTGACRDLAAPERDGNETIFRNMVLSDYPMAIIPRSIFPTSVIPVWLAIFSDANEIVDRSISDRKGDYLEGFWGVLFHETQRLDEKTMAADASGKVRALKRMHAFRKVFPHTKKEIEVKGLAPARAVLHPEGKEWHDSVANLSSHNVNRFFYQLDDAHQRAIVHGVKMGGRLLPHRQWADSPAKAHTWFCIHREAKPTEVFVVVPKEQTFDGGECEIDVSIVPRANAIELTDGAGQMSCIAYWIEAGDDQASNRCTFELPDQAGWLAGTMIIDPRTGASPAQATVQALDGDRAVAIAAPAFSHPVLLIPQGSVERVKAVLQ